MKTKIAITGGIGSGKSTVCEFIRKQNFPVFSCDTIYKELLKDEDYIHAVSQTFPEAVTGKEIALDVLAKIVFADENKRKTLNDLAHPRIMKKLHAYMDECEERLVFAEVPLLFEGNYVSQFDKIIVVTRQKDKRIQAIISRDGISEEDALRRICSQFDYDSENAKKLFQMKNIFCIENNGDWNDLHLSVQDTLVKL